MLRVIDVIGTIIMHINVIMTSFGGIKVPWKSGINLHIVILFLTS